MFLCNVGIDGVRNWQKHTGQGMPGAQDYHLSLILTMFC